MDELLSIGEFSARCGLTAKMLRSYAAAGLLVPAAVDQVTGYRYYLPGQAHQARTIGLLRRADIPLADITPFLRDPTAARIDAWERRLDAELAARRRALDEVRGRVVLDGQPLGKPGELRIRPERKPMTHTMTAGAATDRGLERPTNQDALLAEEPIFAVADGLGRGGEIASVLAVEALRAAFVADQSADGLVRACREANRVVWDRASTTPDLDGMGTTLTAVGVLSGDHAGLVAVSVGDSRVYRFRRGRLEQLTEDHSIVGPLVRSGQLTEEEARRHPQRRMLTQALGVGPELAPGLVTLDGRVNDRLLVCTDGLFNDVAEDEISSVLGATADAARAGEELVRRAATRGGHDNVAVIVIDIT